MFKPLDVVQVPNIAKKGKNPYRRSKNSLHKKFKLSLEQNVTEQTYLKISCRSQKMFISFINPAILFSKTEF